MKVTLKDCLYHSAGEIHGLHVLYGQSFETAVAHHVRLGIVADIDKGEVRNKNGFVSQFVYYDWSQHYKDALNLVFFDFFRGVVLNSVSRMNRGLEP